MPNEQVVAYLRENQGKFSKEVLSEQLKQVGYPEADIAAGISSVYGGAPAAASPGGFWDFKTPWTYRTSWEKTKDALFGFFVPIIFFFVPFLPLLADIFFIAYFWNRRRYISYGVLDRWALGVIVGAAAVFFWMISSL